MRDADAFIEWLRAEGLSEEHLVAYRGFLDELEAQPSLSAAIRAAEDAGKSAKQIANLRKVAARFAEFKEHGAAGAAAPAAPKADDVPPAGRSEPPLDLEAKREPALEVETRESKRATASASAPPLRQALNISAPRRGCSCRARHDVYLDNDFGGLAKMLGGGVGIGTFILIRLVGALGALAIALGLASMGGFATILSICFRCEGCRRRVADLDDDERAHLRKGRGLVVLVTTGLMAGAAVCGYLWWLAMKARNEG